MIFYVHYNNTDINNLTFKSFVTNLDFSFLNNSFNDNLYRNEKNIKHDFDKLEFIEKDNVYNFFKDNKILKTLLFFYDDYDLKSIDVFLIKYYNIHIGTEEELDDLYIQRNLFYFFLEEDKEIFKVHIFYIIVILFYNVVVILELYHSKNINEIKNFYIQ